MRKKTTAFLSALFILLAIVWTQIGSMPFANRSEEVSETNFSTERAFKHVEAIAKKPHFSGSENHVEVRNYLVNELQKLGLFVHTQEGFALNKYGIGAQPQNILTRIEGSENSDALLLLTHYDSAMHSSFGASDAASGVATILEGIRAFLKSGKTPKNDIIIVFTDSEELGLNGAELFVNDHPWAEDVGLALNFESRGSGGASFMLLETTEGNAKLIEHFAAAKNQFPVTNSLAYSVYKMLPNDTDLTVLREQAKINGFNFAFIDDHFDYHTATDIPENLDKNTLAHQGSYLMPLLEYFGNTDLTQLNSREDAIFFDFPVAKIISYPSSWIFPLLIFTAIVFVIVLFYGFKQKRINLKQILKGFLPLLISLIGSAVLVLLLWKACLLLYPQYLEMEHGFTYNGYKYIGVAIFLALTMAFFTYKKFVFTQNFASAFVAILIFWFIISAVAALYLKGASYFILLVLIGLVQLFLLIRQEKSNLLLLSILSLPAIFILMPFVPRFPVALGLKMLFLAAIMTVLLFVLLLPVFVFLKKLKSFGVLCWFISFVLFIIAHFEADFSEERPKPNSLVYILDNENNLASWNTYDKLLDSWNKKYFGDEPSKAKANVAFSSKYNSGLTYTAPAPLRKVPKPDIFVSKIDTISSESVFYNLKIAPNRPINRIDFFADKAFNFQSIKVNGKEANPFKYKGETYHIFTNRLTDNLLTYYASNLDTLRLEIEVKNNQHPELIMYETSHDLLQNELFDVPSRSESMIPRPFVINDAIINKHTIRLE